MRSLLVFLLSIVGAPVFQAHAAITPRVPISDVDRIVAVVNNDVITATELEGRLNQTKRQLATQQIQSPPEGVLKRQVLERMITEDIQLQLAAQNGIRVGDQDVEHAIEVIAKRNHMSVDDLYDTVRHQGFDRDAYHDQIRRQITIQKLIDREITSRITVSDSEVKNYMETTAGQAHSDTEYNISHIYIPVPESATAEQIAAAKRRAAEVERLLRNGEDFARAAVTYSQGPDALTGGALGWKRPGQLPELFLNALKQLQPGGITGVLRGPNGFHILRLDARRDAAVTEESVQQTHVRHILLRPSEIQSLSDVRKRLLQIRQRLEAGADFSELAKTYSEDAVSAANGGDLGWVSPNQLVPEFERAMDRLKPGEISEPVQTPFGLHLIQVLGRRQQTVTGQRRLAAAREQIRARKADDRYEQWVRQLRDEAYVEYLLDE